MTLTIDVAPELEACLRIKATREGRDITTIAEALLARAAELEAQNGAIPLPGSARWERLERLLAGVTEYNRPQEWDVGHAVGGEVW